NIGGAELCLVETTQSLAQRGATVTVFVPRCGRLIERLVSVGAEVRIVPYTWWMAPANRQGILPRLKRQIINFRAISKLAQSIREIRADVVVSNSLTCAVGAFAASRCCVPHIWSIHELHGTNGHGLFFDWGERRGLALVNRLAKRIVVPSHAAWRVYTPALNSEKMRLIRHAIDVPNVPVSRAGGRDVFTVVQLGAVVPTKRAEDAVRAVALLRSSKVPVKLRLVGAEDPAYGKHIRRLIEQENLDGGVALIGFASNPYEHLANADACIMCSVRECAPRVTIEAMKMGLPVVAARSGGLIEQIRDGETGLLFQPGDPCDLAAKIRLLIEAPERRKEIARAGHDWAKANHNLAQHGIEWEAVLLEAIQNGHDR
ncbi:MAG: glycosyltransferase family 4 protein, partial [Verrucomicrobiae bacterium]|nr:glycosyltransferase family 4 protein [Verrucomicrobiae bacterium]